MTRYTCRSCFAPALEPVLSLGSQCLSDFRDTPEPTERYPLDLVLCRHCQLVQLSTTVPPRKLYNDNYGFRSGVNGSIRDDLASIVRSVKPFEPETVVDIGCNDGTLLSNYAEDIYRVGVDPVSKFREFSAQHADVIVNDFFAAPKVLDALHGRAADVVTVISCFYDLEDPNAFVKGLTEILAEEGIVVIQQNYLVSMMKQVAYDNIVHEHLEYYSFASLAPLLRAHGLEVFHVEQSSINGGSFRTYVARKGAYNIGGSVARMKASERFLTTDLLVYDKFAKTVKRAAAELRHTVIDLHAAGKTIYAYGASTRGGTLLQTAELADDHLITAAIERNPEKVGKYMSSTGIPIISEEQAREEKPDYMLVLPWFFRQEFVDREAEYLASGGHLIFPLPTVAIV